MTGKQPGCAFVRHNKGVRPNPVRQEMCASYRSPQRRYAPTRDVAATGLGGHKGRLYGAHNAVNILGMITTPSVSTPGWSTVNSLHTD